MTATVDVRQDDAPPAPSGRAALLVGVLALVAYWPLGFLPHLFDGAGLPISGAWQLSPDPYAEPFVLLPFGDYALASLGAFALLAAAAGIVVPVVVVGLAGRAGRVLVPVGGVRGTAVVVVVLVAAVCLAQTWSVVRDAVLPTERARLLITLLVVTFVVGTVLGLVLGLLATSRRPALRVAAGGVVVGALSWWLLDLAGAVVEGLGFDPAGIVGRWPWWVAAVVLALVLAQARPWRPSGAVAWLVALGVFWCAQPVLTAVGYAAVYARRMAVLGPEQVRELSDATSDVVRAAAAPDAGRVVPVVVAVVAAAALRVALDRRSA